MYNDRTSDWFGSVTIEYCDTDGDCTSWERVPVIEFDEFVTACFTEEGCRNYITKNRHNLNKPFIYASSLYRNDEMISIMNFLSIGDFGKD